MFGIILTPRGSPATRRRPDIDRVNALPRWETTSPQYLEEPAAGLPQGRPTAEEPSPGLRIFDPKSQTARARRILGMELTYIAHPSFDDPRAQVAILAPMPAPDVAQAPRRKRATEGLPPYLASLYDEGTLLSREQEAHLFRKMNYLKSPPAVSATSSIRPAPHCRPRRGRPSLEDALAIRNQIVRANLAGRLDRQTAARPGDDLSSASATATTR